MIPSPRPPRRRGGPTRAATPATSAQRGAPDRRTLAALLARLEAAGDPAPDGEVGDEPRAQGEVAQAEESWRPGEAWDEREAWDDPPRPAPALAEGGLAVTSRRGEIGGTWWSKRFLSAMEAAMVGGQLRRGRRYARRGHVVDLDMRPGLVDAHVQGTLETPYRVRLRMPVVADADWDRIVGALAAEAGYAARMLAGELPRELEDVFEAHGASLLPGPYARLTTDCTCPDWDDPCAHVAAVCYLLAESFDRDPFGVLAWRGRDRVAVLGALRRGRAGAPEPPGAAGPGVDGHAAPAWPPLAGCVADFWVAGPELAALRVRPRAAEIPAAVLRHVPAGLLDVGGRDVAELLAATYAAITSAAERRGVPDGG